MKKKLLRGDKNHPRGRMKVYLWPLKIINCIENIQTNQHLNYSHLVLIGCSSPTKQIQWLGDDSKYNRAQSKIQPDF